MSNFPLIELQEKIERKKHKEEKEQEETRMKA